jgi:hypothetical protein
MAIITQNVINPPMYGGRISVKRRRSATNAKNANIANSSVIDVTAV